MSRKDNGLFATSYTRLVDVESPVVDGLLDRLRDEDVAAYVAPAPGRRGPYGDTVLPLSPSDTVYVDADRHDQAKAVVDRYLVEVREELLWASIVSSYDAPTTDPTPRWPASEDVPTKDADDAVGAGDADPMTQPSRVVRPAEATIGFEELRDVVAHGPGEDVDEHYQPPTPPPVSLPDPLTRFAWAGVLGGPLFLLVATMFGVDISGWLGLFAIGAFVGGFVTLVARMPDRAPDDLGGDDGAVV
jgi:hypothetical protein